MSTMRYGIQLTNKVRVTDKVKKTRYIKVAQLAQNKSLFTSDRGSDNIDVHEFEEATHEVGKIRCKGIRGRYIQCIDVESVF